MNAVNATFTHVTLLVGLAIWTYRSLLFYSKEWEGYCEHWDDRSNFLVNPHAQSSLSFSTLYSMCTTSRINVWEPGSHLLKNAVFSFGGGAWAQRCMTWIFHTASSVCLYFFSKKALTLYENDIDHGSKCVNDCNSDYDSDSDSDHDSNGRDVRGAHSEVNDMCMPRSTACFIGAAVWLVHPLHSEVIGWASAQPYAPAVFLGMCSLFTYLSYFEQRTHTLMLQSILLFGCGLLFKTVILPLLPVAVLALEVVFGSIKNTFQNMSMVGYLIVGGWVGWIGMIENNGSDTDMVAISSWMQRCVKANSMIWMYVRLFLWPSTLRPHYRLPGTFGDGRNAYTLGVNFSALDGTIAAMYTGVAALLCVQSFSSLTSLLLRPSMQWKIFVASFMYICVCFVPTAGLIQHGMVQAGGDRYAYVPSLVAVVLVAAGLRCVHHNRWVYLCAFLFLLTNSEMCNQQVQIWKNDETMLQYSLKVDPHDWRAFVTLIDARHERGEDVSTLVAKALDVMPHYQTADHSRTLRIKIALSTAHLLLLQNDWTAACALYEKCVKYRAPVDGGTHLIDGDHNANIMALINAATCRCIGIQEMDAEVVESAADEIQHFLQLAATSAASDLTEKRIADVARYNLMQFQQWQEKGFLGNTAQMDLLF